MLCRFCFSHRNFGCFDLVSLIVPSTFVIFPIGITVICNIICLWMGNLYAATPGQNPGVARIYIYIHYIYIYVHSLYICIYIHTIYTYVNSPSTNHQECLPTSTASSLPSGRGLVPLEWCGGRGGAGPGEPSPGSPVGSGRHPEVRYPPSMAPPPKKKISGTTDMEGFFQTHIHIYIYYCILYN